MPKWVFNKKTATFMTKDMSDKIDGIKPRPNPYRTRMLYTRDAPDARVAYEEYKKECLEYRSAPVSYEQWLKKRGQIAPL